MAASAQDIKARYGDWVTAQAATASAQSAVTAAQTNLSTAQGAESTAASAFKTTLDEGQTVVPPPGADHVIRLVQGALVKEPATFLGD